MTEYDDTRALGQKGLKRLCELVKSALSNKQDALVSGSNIKTVNGESLVGSGDLQVGEGLTYALSKSGHVISLTDSGGTSQTVSDGYLATSLSYAQLTRQLTLNGENSSVTLPLASYGTNGVPGMVSQTGAKRLDCIGAESGDGIVSLVAPGSGVYEGGSLVGNLRQRIILTEYGNLRRDTKPYGSDTWEPQDYFVKTHRPGDEVTLNFDTAGYVTSSGTQVRFSVPLSRPVDTGVSTITIDVDDDGEAPSQHGFILRQGGNYTHGSTAETYVRPSSSTCSYRGDGFVNVVLTFSSTANAINNDAIGINVGHMRLIFS